MEFIAGRSLKARLDETPLPPDEVAAIGAKIAVALHDLHRQHVIHLDLKPSNVIMRDDGEAVLIDFGLSRHDQLPDLIAEEFDGPIGTGPYIAPEQVLGERGDPRSDLFALGVILYFLATGERPFGEPQRAARMAPPAVARSGAAAPPGTRRFRPGCRRSSCAASRSTRPSATRPRRSSPSTLRNPECVLLTARAERRERDGIDRRSRLRWLRARQARAAARAAASRRMLARAPIIMAAIDLAPGHEGLREALAVAVAPRCSRPSPARGSPASTCSKISLLAHRSGSRTRRAATCICSAWSSSSTGRARCRSPASASPIMCSRRPTRPAR